LQAISLIFASTVSAGTPFIMARNFRDGFSYPYPRWHCFDVTPRKRQALRACGHGHVASETTRYVAINYSVAATRNTRFCALPTWKGTSDCALPAGRLIADYRADQLGLLNASEQAGAAFKFIPFRQLAPNHSRVAGSRLGKSRLPTLRLPLTPEALHLPCAYAFNEVCPPTRPANW